MKQSVLMQDLVSIPECPQVKLLGNGRVRDHEGIPDVELRHPSHRSFHPTPLTDEQMAAASPAFTAGTWTRRSTTCIRRR